MEVEGELLGTNITWTERDDNAVLTMHGTLVGDTIELVFSGVFRNGKTVVGEGKLMCQ